ncbi:MAG: winged helix-turn-helix transcriptional regulator [Acidobacteria bacterium]|nr:winged helix-turn-helix transcriptional regulator [Acidobacteriota bacterium]
MRDARIASAGFLLRASRVLKTLGHPTRLEIIKYLQEGERSVAEIQNHLRLIQSMTSQHLRLMYKRGIVKFRREGTTCYYSIANEFIHRILTCFTECERKLESGRWDMGWLGYEIGKKGAPAAKRKIPVGSTGGN